MTLINKIILKHSHAHSFTYFPYFHSQIMVAVCRVVTKTDDLLGLKFYYVALFRESSPTPERQPHFSITK